MFSGSRIAAPWSEPRQRTAAVALAAILWVQASCGDTPATNRTPSKVDSNVASAAATPASSAPQRVLSLYPSATEIVVQLGGAGWLVARTDFDVDPRLAHLPSLGPTLTPSLEAVVALRPDLVIVASGTDIGGGSIGRLRELGVPLEVVDIQTIQDVFDSTRRIGIILGVPGRSDSAAAQMETELARTRERHDDCTPIRALFVLWPDPPRTAGPGTYVDELILIAGARNVFHDIRGQWAEPAIEEIVRRNPDILILPGAPRGPPLTAASLARRVGWRDLRAVREGRVLEVEGDLFNRPGARVAEAARTLGRLFDAAFEGRCPA